MVDSPPPDPVVIIGGGLTGISAAMHLGGPRPWRLLERDSSLGGLARTEQRDGFSFDHTGHWLHLRDPCIQDLVRGLLGDGLCEVERVARIHSHGRRTLYPFQGNLHGLPADVIHECLVSYIKALLSRGEAEPRNFEEYINHHFGDGIGRHFMIPYNTKLWGVSPREITSAWCSRFVPRPDLEQVVAGAVGAGQSQLGYNVRFLYPKQGGIETLSRTLASRLDPARVSLNTAVSAVDQRARTVTTSQGETVPYHAMVSTMPLPELVACMADPPESVQEAASKLRATAVRYLNVASRKPVPEAYHWVYTPEQHLPFYRVGSFSNAVPSMAPAGCSNLYVELAGRHEPDDAEVKQALGALVEIGALSAVEDVLFADVRNIECAYVIFDDNYEAALGTIFPYLERHRIYSRGRYGAWIYNAMEDSLLAGKEVAALIDAVNP